MIKKNLKKIVSVMLVTAVTLTSIQIDSFAAEIEKTVISGEQQTGYNKEEQTGYREEKTEYEEAYQTDWLNKRFDLSESYVEIPEQMIKTCQEIAEGLKVEEIIESNKNSTTYRLRNGSKKFELYSSEVRYKDEKGKLRDYDPTLVNISEDAVLNNKRLENYKYENKSGDRKNYIPSELSKENPIILENKDYIIEMSPVIEGNKKENNAFKEIDELLEAQKVKDTVTDLYEQERQAVVAVTYKDKEEKMELEYVSNDNGVKENIILNEMPQSNQFRFEIRLQNLEPEISKFTKGINLFKKGSEEIIGGIEAPYMNDATGKAYSEELFYDIEPKKNAEDAYILTLTVSEEYLKDAVYPVTIDPSASWVGSDSFYDVYVMNGSSYRDTNFYDSAVTTMSVGVGAQRVSRTYVKFPDLKSTIGGQYVDSATLSVYETGSYAGATIRAQRVTESWTVGSITWNNQPSFSSTVLSSFKSTGVTGQGSTLDVTSFARDIANGTNTNLGLVLKSSDESGSGQYTKYYGTRTSTSSKRPKLSVVYYDGPTQADSVTLNDNYIKKGTEVKVSWSGIQSNYLSKVNYKLTKHDDDTGAAGDDITLYADSPNLGATSSGTKAISASTGWADGCYRVYVRGTDKGGISGLGKSATLHIDSAAPTLSSAAITPSTSTSVYSNSVPTVAWSGAGDKHFKQVECSVNDGTYQVLGTTASGSKALASSLFTTAGTYTIKVRAVDKADNISAIKTLTYYYDNTAPTLTASIPGFTTTTVYTNTVGTFAWSASDTTFANVQYSVNGGNYKALSSATSGSVSLVNDIKTAGTYTINVKATDKAGNTTIKTITYCYDNVAPVLGHISIIPTSSETNYINVLPIITWSDITETNFKEVQYSVNNGNFKTLSSAEAGGAQLSASDFGEKGKYSICIRVVDKAGNYSNIKTAEYYYKDYVSEVEEYVPENVFAIERVGGNTLIGLDIQDYTVPSDVVYEIYRGTTPMFITGSDTLVKGNLQELSCEIKGNANTRYYYKVRAVRIDKNGNPKATSDFSEEIDSLTLPENEISKRVGMKDTYEYEGFNTPNGIGQIEKSQGNFVYTQTDLSLATPQLALGVARVYNANSNMISGFGFGWSFSYDAYVTLGDNGNTLLYQDGTRTIYTFVKGTDGKYTCKDTKDLSIEVGEKNHNKKISSDEVVSAFFTSNYVITNKENIKYYFDSCGRLTLIEEENGTFLYIIYNEKTGVLEEIYSSSGQKIDFNYTQKQTDGHYLIGKIILQDNSYFQYDYTEGRLTKVTHVDSKGNKINYIYEYNTDGKLSTINDAKGNPYKIQYNGESVSKAIYPDNERVEVSISNLESTFSAKKADGTELYNEKCEFDAEGKVLTKTDAWGNVSKYTYIGDLLDTSKQIKEYHKIENGIVVSGTVELNDKAKYDSQGNLIEHTDSEGCVTKYEYAQDSINSKFPTLVTETDKNGIVVSKTAYVYNALGNVERKTDYIDNTITTYQYDTDGNATQTKETLVAENINLANVSDTNLSKGLDVTEEEYGYDDDGNIEESDFSTGTIEESEKNQYDILCRIICSEDEKKIITNYIYDGFGRVIEIKTKYPNKDKEEITKSKYDANGLVIEETDKLDRVTTYEYDNRGRVIKQTLSYKEETRITTTSYGYEKITVHTGTDKDNEVTCKVVTVKNTINEVVAKVYTNRLGQTVRELSNGVYVDYTYDKQGNVFTAFSSGVDETDISQGKLTVSVYDKNGYLTDTIINPIYKNGAFTIDEQNSIVESNQYDESGNQVSSIDGKGNEETYTYDESGRITEVSFKDKTGVLNKTMYAYDIQNMDASGNIISTTDRTTDGLGRISETVSNGAGQVLSIMDKAPTGNIKTIYEYDTSGNKVKESYSNGCSIVYIYDAKNLMTAQKEYSANGTWVKTVTYYYDEEDVLIKSVDYNVSGSKETPYRYTIYEYDKLNRMTGYAEVNQTSQPSEPTINSHKITYVYDIEDKLVKILYPKASQDKLKGITFEYNSFKWLTAIKGIVVENGTEVSRNIRTYEYYNDSKVKMIKDYRGFLKGTNETIQRTYEYDVFDRVTKMTYVDGDNTDRVLEQYQYTYDKNNNILSETIKSNYSSNPAGKMNETRNYTYDSLDRLIESSIENHEAHTTSNTSYTFDMVGNRTKMVKDGVTTTYTYNELNQLTKSVETENNMTLSSISYSYDASGNQISEVDVQNNKVTTNEYDVNNQLIKTIKNTLIQGGTAYTQTNTYNSEGQRISKTDNGVTTYYYYQGSVLLYTTDADGNKTSQNIIGAEGNIIATIRYESDGQHAYFYNKDIKTSTTNVIAENGDSVVNYQYDDYGNTTKVGNQDFYNEICYTGGIYDEFTELYYLNARYYSPSEGMFLTQDSYRGEQKEANTWHLYAYCAGNPISYMDPTGHMAVPAWLKDLGRGIRDGFVATFTDIPKSIMAICNDPKKVIKDYFSPESIALRIVDPTGFGRKWYAAGKALIEGDMYTIGYIEGGNIGEASIVLLTEAAAKAYKLPKQSKLPSLKSGGMQAIKKLVKKIKPGSKRKLTFNKGTRGAKTTSPYDLTKTHRQTMSKNKMSELIADIEKNGIKKSVKYVEHNGTKYIVNGHHRVIAMKRLGKKQVPIEKVELPYKGYKTIADLMWID